MEYTNCSRTYSLKEDFSGNLSTSLSRAFAMFRKKGRDKPVLTRWTRLVNRILLEYDKTHAVLGPRLKRWDALYESAMHNAEFNRLVNRSGARKAAAASSADSSVAGPDMVKVPACV